MWWFNKPEIDYSKLVKEVLKDPVFRDYLKDYLCEARERAVEELQSDIRNDYRFATMNADRKLEEVLTTRFVDSVFENAEAEVLKKFSLKDITKLVETGIKERAKEIMKGRGK